MVGRETNRKGGWSFRPDTPVTEPLDVSMTVPAPSGGGPVDVHLVFTDDGLYVPAIVRTPPGDGPFPTVIAIHGGSGGLGVAWLVDFVRNRGYALDRFLDAGYAVCFTEGRMEREEAYQMYQTDRIEETTPPIPAVLDHHDVISTYEHVQDQPFVDADRIAFFGVSHGGELQMKLVTELQDGPAALVPMEPAGIEYLGLQYERPRTYENLQFNEELDDSRIDFDRAWENIQRISDDVPIMVGGRDDDHLQGLFHKLYELLDRADKNATWESWDHPEHAYQWGPRRTEPTEEPSEYSRDDEGGASRLADIDERYDVDGPTEGTIDRVIAFLDEHVKGQ